MITFITGGVKSGKSDFALKIAEKSVQKKSCFFIATAQALDDEMKSRIKKHQQQRQDFWQTIEESINLEQAFSAVRDKSIVLVDSYLHYPNYSKQ